MEKLTNAIESLSQDELARLRAALGVTASASRPAILKTMVSFGGIDRLLSDRPRDEISILALLSHSDNGMTYSELSRELGIESDIIESISIGLSSRCMVFILKNRKHLNNRLDKVYLHKPLQDMLFFMKDKDIIEHASQMEKSFATPASGPGKESKKDFPLLTALLEEGGVSTYSILSERLSGQNVDQILTDAHNKNLIKVIHAADPPFGTIIVLDTKGLLAIRDRREAPSKIKAYNHYSMLNNLLCAYDIVSTRGLYLTQQRDFRKTDFKRVSDTMLPLIDHRGMSIDPDDSARLALHIFSRLGTLSIRKEAVQIDLSSIEKELTDPVKFRTHALKAALKKSTDEGIFASPFPQPAQEEVQSILDQVTEQKEVDLSQLRVAFILGKCAIHPASIRTIGDGRSTVVEQFNAALRYSVLFGLVDIEGGIIKAANLEGFEEDHPTAYINPDYTIMLPTHEMPPDVLYRALSCTELVKNDVVMHCRITRDSVLAAHKRRMHPDKIISELEKHLKNGVPQNMIFMVREWIAQSLELGISDVTLLRVNHPAFIDDLLAGNLKSSVLERISPTHAIVDRESIDDIVRAATKNGAIISLFSE